MNEFWMVKKSILKKIIINNKDPKKPEAPKICKLMQFQEKHPYL
jgi:hypothetical protein